MLFANDTLQGVHEQESPAAAYALLLLKGVHAQGFTVTKTTVYVYRAELQTLFTNLLGEMQVSSLETDTRFLIGFLSTIRALKLHGKVV